MQGLREGSDFWKNVPGKNLDDLQALLREKNNDELLVCLQKILLERHCRIFQGIHLLAQQKVSSQSMKAMHLSASVVWQKGSCRLLRYANHVRQRNVVVLCIPSLINRSYIFDLCEQHSFVRYLAAYGYEVFLLDWQSPKPEEKHFGMKEYVTEHILGAAHHMTQLTPGKKIALAGYCMGGLLACAASVYGERIFSGLALFAMPWNFHDRDFIRVALPEHVLATLEHTVHSVDIIPAWFIQSLFYYLYHDLLEKKFYHFSREFSGGKLPKSVRFIEHWANDGIDMTRHIFKACVIDFLGYNFTMKNNWCVGDKNIVPKYLNLPVFFAMPKKDRVVPLSCSQPFVSQLRQVRVIYPEATHIGMLAGRNAEHSLWLPFKKWLQEF